MGYATWLEDPFHDVLIRTDVEPLDALAHLIGDAGEQAEKRGAVIWRDESLPEPEEAKGLLVHEHDPSKPSDFFKAAKTTLPKASRFYGPLFDPTKPFTADKGTRYTTLRSACAWATYYLVGVDGIGPAHVYALFHQQVAQWGDDDGTPFLERAWTFIQHFWSLDESRVRGEAIEAQLQARDAQDIIQGMIDGVAQWYPPIATMEFKDARKWVSRRLICSLSGSTLFYVMDMNGHYSNNGVNLLQLIPALAQRGLGRIIKLKNEEGKYRSATELLNAHLTSVSSMRFEAGSVYSRVDQPDEPSSALCFGVYARRADLEPRWDPAVDAWLEQLAGPRYETLCEWIGHALAFDQGALPMLSIVGPPDVGKKLICQGLAECLVDATTVDGEALFGNWNDPLLRSPFVVIDEGWSLGAVKHPADRLREVIGAPEIRLRRRFKDTASLHADLRVIITSNNMDTITRLGFGKDLDGDARRALSDRLIHIQVPATCPGWLKAKGGMRFTAAPGRRWIAGSGRNKPSDYVLARHFLKLHEMTQQSRDEQSTRFLMSGLTDKHCDPEVQAELQTSSGKAVTVLTALCRMVNAATAGKPTGDLEKIAVHAEQDAIFVLNGGLYDFAKSQTDYFSSAEVGTIKQFQKAVDNLSKPIPGSGPIASLVTSCSDGRYVLLSRKRLGAQRWKLLDAKLVYSAALKWGIAVPALARIAEGGADVIPFPGSAAEEPPAPAAPSVQEVFA